MFDATLFKSNDALFEQCHAAIKQHNNISYQKVEFKLPTVEFKFISTLSPKDSLSKEIVMFYETYSAQMIASGAIKNIVGNINYTNEDLVLHIDRSEDSILQILSSLTKVRIELEELHARIMKNIISQSEQFIDYVSGVATNDYSELAQVVFICMEEKGLENKIETHGINNSFISVGVDILKRIQTNASPDVISAIHTMNSKLKHVVLNARPALQEHIANINRLQTFGLVPDEGETKTLKECMHALYGIDIADGKPLLELSDSIENALKMHSKSTGKNIGLIVIGSSNQDMYFDMTPLLEITKSNPSAGVTSEMVKNSHLIRMGSSPALKSYGITAINVGDETQTAHVLWTNDMIHFKMRTASIDQSIIKKIMLKAPSTLIKAYNETLTNAMNYNKSDDDAMLFKRVQYMTFNEEITKQDFLKSLEAELISAVVKKVGNKTDTALVALVLSDEFADLVLDILDSFKSKMGVERTKLSAHTHIIYASMSMGILAKIKKVLLKHQSGVLKAELSEVVNTTLNANDNIYTRSIASHYLHIA